MAGRISRLNAELRRRHVFKVALIYAVTGWVVIQVAATTFPLLSLPMWGVTLVLALVVLGFPITMIGAWTYDLTDKGLVVTPSAADTSTAIGSPAEHASGANPEGTQSRADSIPVLAVNAASAARPTQLIPNVQPLRPECVAVLPFLNLSADPENDYFADGITEDVIAHLSKVGALRVISRSSVMVFKKRERSLREIASALGAATLLEGSVRRAADRVRIVAELVDAQTEQYLWAETYDRRLTDVFAIQTDVALHIAAALRAKLSPDESSRIKKEPTQNVQAYQLYLQGRHCYLRYTDEGMHQGLALFARAVELDPNYALGYAAIAMANSELGETGALEPDTAYPAAKAAVAKALELDSDLAEAHCVAGHLKCVYDFDWVGAERDFKRALELSPSNADAYDLFGRMCAGIGRHDEAIALTMRANELDPLAHRSDLATAFLRAGRLDEAITLAERAVDLEPYYARAHATLGWGYMLKGWADKGIAELEKAVELAPEDTTWIAQLGQAYGTIGRVSDARAIQHRLEALSTRRYVAPYHMAYLYTGLGDQERAMDLLEQAWNARAGAIYGIKGSFLFASLRSHPRFRALLERMNLS